MIRLDGGKRILVLGPTGVEKKYALEQLQRWAVPTLGFCKIVNFEKDFLCKRGDTPLDYLGQRPLDRAANWAKSWERALEAHPSLSNQASEDCLLVMLHGVMVHSLWGVSMEANLGLIAGVDWDVVVTLIDDVCDMWVRTECRAEGEERKGRPWLEHLAVARRFEMAVGDAVAAQVESRTGRPCPHFCFAVKHDAVTVGKALFDPHRKVTYLSFPIRRPRELLLKRGIGAAWRPSPLRCAQRTN